MMKLKQMTLLFPALVIAMVCLILTAAAQGTFVSNSTVTFGEKGVTPPVDPENPTIPQEPPEVTGTGQQGNLTLDVVPHPFFGQYPVPTLNTVLNSKIVGGIGGNGVAGAQTFIQVSDARSIGNDGWNVSVKADLFINSEDPDNHISGAKIIFRQGEVAGHSATDKPTSRAVVLNCINDLAQNEENIFVANSGEGIGTWVSRLYPTPWNSPAILSDNELIQLSIPANSGAIENKTYSSHLTWTLSEVP